MSDTESNLTVAELSEQLERMKERIATLEEAVQFLAFCKQCEPSFAFYDWLVKNRVFNEQRTRLELVLGVLEDRLAGRDFTFQKSVPGIPDEQLYQQTRPIPERARVLLMAALKTQNPTIIDELFQALASQERNQELVAWWQRETSEG